MENFSKRTLLDRLKIELQARGISLRQLDAMLPEGKRQIFQPAKDRPLDLDDILTILRVAGIDPTVFFGQVAGYGHPLEVGALRVGGSPKWTKDQSRVLRELRNIDARGSRGCESFRERLRELDCLREENPSLAEKETWAALGNTQEPGAIVGMLAMLAINAPRVQAYHLLQLGIELLAGQLKSLAGAKIAMASGRCFTKASLVQEGLTILENFALPLAARYGAAEDHAAALIYISHAEAALGLNRTGSLWKAVEIGDDRLSFVALQVIAAHQLNLGDIQEAANMYDDLIRMPYFKVAPKAARAAINCSRLAAHFVAGRLGLDSVEDFRKAVAESRVVLSKSDQVSCVMDFVLFLAALGKDDEVQSLLGAELWNVPECVNGFETRRFRYLGTFIDLLSKAKTKAKDTVRAALHRRGQG